MKTIIKSALLAAILIAAPAHAMFSRMGKRLALTSGLMGTSGYGIAKLYAKNKTKENEKRIDCGTDIAKLTSRVLKTAEDSEYYAFLMKERAQAFTYCQRMLPREEIYKRNIAYATLTSQQMHLLAQAWGNIGTATEILAGSALKLPKSDASQKIVDVSLCAATQIKRCKVDSDKWKATAQHLTYELEQEQAQKNIPSHVSLFKNKWRKLWKL